MPAIFAACTRETEGLHSTTLVSSKFLIYTLRQVSTISTFNLLEKS